jgi:hypothetical protein
MARRGQTRSDAQSLIDRVGGAMIGLETRGGDGRWRHYGDGVETDHLSAKAGGNVLFKCGESHTYTSTLA